MTIPSVVNPISLLKRSFLSLECFYCFSILEIYAYVLPRLTSSTMIFSPSSFKHNGLFMYIYHVQNLSLLDTQVFYQNIRLAILHRFIFFIFCLQFLCIQRFQPIMYISYIVDDSIVLRS